jgi:hypothetical protein
LPVAGMGDLQFLNARANPSYVVLVPQGQLDAQYFESIRRSIQPNKEWVAKISAHINTLRVNEIKEVAKRNQIWQNTNEQIAQMRTDVWNNNQRSSDQRAIEFSQFIRYPA